MTALDDAHIADLLRAYSLEVSARDPAVAERLRGELAPGSDVFISFVPGETHHRIVRTAVALRRAGFNPVPHVAVRNLASVAQLDDYLSRAAGEAGVARALVIAGDVDPPRGPFGSSLELLASGVFQKHGIRSVGIAGYPEGSAKIAPATLDEALDRKAALARTSELELWIATQFCFEAAPIVRWIAAIRRRGITLPVRIGLAGPANVLTLLKFAVRCGIGNSLRGLQTHADSVTRLLGEDGPDRVVRDLAASFAGTEATGIAELHFFPFGGVLKTTEWVRTTLKRLSADDAVVPTIL
jgi:methylenetetrahydrofolate reductase (NADPH)